MNATIADYRDMITELADQLELDRRCLLGDVRAKHPLAERARELLAAADEPERC